jgi:hypothetical protein
MRLERVAVGDVIKARIKGRSLWGEVTEVKDGIVYFSPISPAAGWRHARSTRDTSLEASHAPVSGRRRRPAAGGWGGGAVLLHALLAGILTTGGASPRGAAVKVWPALPDTGGADRAFGPSLATARMR